MPYQELSTINSCWQVVHLASAADGSVLLNMFMELATGNFCLLLLHPFHSCIPCGRTGLPNEKGAYISGLNNFAFPIEVTSWLTLEG